MPFFIIFGEFMSRHTVGYKIPTVSPPQTGVCLPSPDSVSHSPGVHSISHWHPSTYFSFLPTPAPPVSPLCPLHTYLVSLSRETWEECTDLSGETKHRTAKFKFYSKVWIAKLKSRQILVDREIKVPPTPTPTVQYSTIQYSTLIVQPRLRRGRRFDQ